VFVSSTSQLRYREIESNGRPNINCRNGTVRFWFKPNWSSTNAGGAGPGASFARLIELGGWTADASRGHWQVQFNGPGATNLSVFSQSNGVSQAYWAVPCGFTAGRWYQFALAYSPSNVALYMNGQLMTNSAMETGDDRPAVAATGERINTAGGGIYNYPPPDVRALGFGLGNAADGGEQANAQFEELETFNYPLTPQQIARDFQALSSVAMATNDFDYDGRSDFLEAYVDGTATNDASAVVGGRLGYWRFNGAITNLLGEALQTPIYTNGVQVASSWSSNALVVPPGSARLVYRDVETNGWANFNARSGAVRFWFRPRWTDDGLGGDGSFLFLGSATSEASGMWDLGVTTQGKTVRFRTATNGSVTTVLQTANQFGFTSNKWHQIALNYGPSSAVLYVNGSLVLSNNVGVTQWPALADRANGLAIGNNHAGNRSINADFDEVETFNRQLTAAEIQRSFDTVKASDDNLNGVPDLLEDPVLSAPVPFPGFPFVITGTIESEQFDRGGQDVSYHGNGGNTVTNDYRPSGMQIVTNTADRGAGFIVDNLRSNEWLKYTLDVRVAQNYAVDVRAAGLGTGGVFHVEFATNATSGAYTNTGPLTLLTTNWTNVIRTLLPLRAGTNLMKVVMDTNAAGGKVCQLNYISIYPSWVEGATNLSANVDVTGLTANDSSWTAATNNAARIQAAINSLSTTGTVTIPSGTYYLAQKSPIEALNKDAQDNTAVFVSKSNLEIRGAGKTNTVLVAHNRATTLFYLGRASAQSRSSVTNLTLTSATIEGRPHQVAVADSGAGGYTNCWEDGALLRPQFTVLGDLIVVTGFDSANRTLNLLFTNCLFRNASIYPIGVIGTTSNCAVRSCDFFFRDGTNGTFPFPRSVSASPCHTNSATTTNYPSGGVGFLVAGGNQGLHNGLMFDCTFNGSPGMISVNTNHEADAGDGIFWSQEAGNCFVGRCAITNYGLEGVQFGAGPAASTGNEFHSLVSVFACTALYAVHYWIGPTDSTNDHAFYLVGNTVSGGRHGYDGGQQDTNAGFAKPYAAHVSGNALDLFPAFPLAEDFPGTAVFGGEMALANIAGNRMIAGGHGVRWVNATASAVVLKNDFASATYRGLAYNGTNGVARHFLVLRNTIGQGASFHLRQPAGAPDCFFLGENVFKDGTNTVNPFFERAATPVHLRY
jgi:hypothetical protein